MVSGDPLRHLRPTHSSRLDDIAKEDAELTESDRLPPGIDVLILPGLVGKREGPMSTGELPYPPSTADFRKVFAAAGLRVEYSVDASERVTLSLKAADWWVPVLLFAQGVVQSGLGNLVYDYIRERLSDDELKTTALHMRVGREEADGTRTWYEASGPGSEVLKGYKKWLAHERED